MTHLELFQSFVAPAIFISATGLIVLTLNARLMGIVSRLRAFHKEKHLANLAKKKQDVLILQAQIKSIEQRATKIKNAYFYILVAITGIMITCLMLGLSLYLPQAFMFAIVIFVCSMIVMICGMFYFISEIAISLSSEKEEDKFYELVDVISEDNQSDCGTLS